MVVVSDPSSGRHRRRRPSGEPPPLPHELNRAAYAWLVAFAFWAAIWVSVFLKDGPAIVITEWDLAVMAPIVDNRQAWLTPTMQWLTAFGTHFLNPIIGWSTLVAALWFRRVRHALLLIAALVITNGTVNLVAARILRPRPLGVEIIGDWEGFAQPSRPIAVLSAAMIAATLTLVPAANRRWAHVVTVLVVALMGFAQIYTGVTHPTDVLAGASVGVAFCLVLYRTLAPEAVFPISYDGRKTAHLDVEGARGEAIRLGLDTQLGVEASDIRLVGLEGSAGSTPLRIEAIDGVVYFGKLYAKSHLRSDRSYKLWRTLVYGRLEDEQHFTSVLRLVQHEDYMLHVMARVGVPSAAVVGIVEITPDREYLLVTEFLSGAVEIGDIPVDEAIIDEGLEIVETMWRTGLAHRDIKPANVMVQDGHIRLIDVAFAQVRPSPWRQAVDLANMMLVLALQSSPELVYERAQLRYTDEELAEAFAASRGVTLPSGLRRSLRQDGRELLQRFRQLAPELRPVSIQRWSLRRVGLTLWVALVAFAVVSMFISSLADLGLR
jgi:tRNA A-37 threonylcarbamoyl transferase component Bud32/membrane-associated phospholipid phosphatase